MLFSRSPIVGILIIGSFLLIYILTKTRKKSSNGIGGFSFHFGKRSLSQNTNMTEFLQFLILQQMLDVDKTERNSLKVSQANNAVISTNEEYNERNEYLERQKQEILALLRNNEV